MAKKYHNIGSMIERRDRNSGDPVLDAKGKRQYYIKVDKKADIRINGHKIEPGSFISVERPTSKFDRMLEKGTITKAEHEIKCADFEKDGELSYIQFELTVVEEN